MKQERRQRSRGADARATSESQHQEPAPWPSRVRPEDKARKISHIERFDSHAGLRHGLREIAALKGEWAGIPMPLDSERLVIEPNYQKAKELMEIGPAEPAEDDEFKGAVVVNKWWSDRRRGDIVIFRHADGRTDWGLHPGVHHFGLDLQTLGCSQAWGIEQEHNALMLLEEMVRHHTFKQYLMTGMFLETSKRSGVTYIFRKLRPTVAMRHVGVKTPRILCTLCLHPIGYYAGTWAGAMCPTDDVVAHLSLMRGDEAMFWKRANQCPPWRPEAGL